MKLIVGLGNPGKEYENTRHNTGRIMVALVQKKLEDKKIKFITPDTFMNNSGKIVAPLIKSKKAAETLVVVHDDLDIPLGKLKISFNKNSGGHRGVESIIRAIKTENFIRIRIGISGETASGKIKKPQGEEKVIDTILGDFKKTEILDLKKIIKKASLALGMVIKDGWSIAASQLGNL